MAKRPQNQEEHYQDAKRYLAQYPLRTAEEERDYAAEWMASANAFQDVLNDALRRLQESHAEAAALRGENLALKKEIVAKDTSFKSPKMGIA